MIVSSGEPDRKSSRIRFIFLDALSHENVYLWESGAIEVFRKYFQSAISGGKMVREYFVSSN
jgi:hypothetical protein